MSTRSILSSLDAVIAELPFNVDDYDDVNKAYERWIRDDSAEDKYAVDVWTYCYVSRYFALQFLKSHHTSVADVDRLIDVTFGKLYKAREDLMRPDRYTAWVGVICRNSYLNYLRSKSLVYGADPDLRVAEVKSDLHYDRRLVSEAVSRAIERLPRYLQDTARLRFVEGRTYSEIAAETSKSIPTLRAYANKALKVLREDEEMRRVFDEIQ